MPTQPKYRRELTMQLNLDGSFVYPLDEMKSAYQKAIRRSLEEDALYWAARMHERGYDEILWRRIHVIASEDIGLADSNVAVQIAVLHNQYDKSKQDTTHSDGVLFLVHAVMILVRAPKSRIVDNAICAVFREKPDNREIPDYSVDKHCERGRNLGRGNNIKGWTHFYDEGAKLVAYTGQPCPLDPYEQRARLAQGVKNV